MRINQFHGTYFSITLIFILMSLGSVKSYRRFKKLSESTHQIQKKAYIYLHSFSVSSFSSSGTHQSHHLDGCQVISKVLALELRQGKQ